MSGKVFVCCAKRNRYQDSFSLVRFFSNNTEIEEKQKTRPVSLYGRLRAKIKATGPITVAEYMKEVLTNPSLGYYMGKDVFGSRGDFTTSPEISQLFGEMIAIWFINEWTNIGRPRPVQFIELGPGRGTMIEDILRVLRKLNLLDGLSVHLVEISETLSLLQEKKLCLPQSATKHDDNNNNLYYKSGVTKDNVPIYWYRSLQDIKNEHFSLVVAHEFFDALPIHKLQKTEHGWREVLIDIDEKAAGEKFRYIISKGATPVSKVFVSESETRDHVEVSPQSILTMQHLAARLSTYGGIALIVDYGHCATKTDTFRAYRNHSQCDPLLEPGLADLTADVDFSSLKAAVSDKLISFGPISQKQFLTTMQIELRLKMLLKDCKNEEEQKSLISGFKMLTEDMGSCFHVVAFYPATLKEYLQLYPGYGFNT